MKYIMFDDFSYVIFPNFMVHKDVARGIGNYNRHPISAGFIRLQYGKVKQINPFNKEDSCEVDDVTAITYGKSETLKLEARAEDGRIISRHFSIYS